MYLGGLLTMKRFQKNRTFLKTNAALEVRVMILSAWGNGHVSLYMIDKKVATC